MRLRDVPIVGSVFGRSIYSVYKYLRTIPRKVKEVDYWFYNISNLAYTLITLLHLSWVVVFNVIGQNTMMLVQFASITLYLIAIVLNRKGYHIISMVIALMEVNMHQVVAVILLGRDTGFQNFIPLISILPFLKYNSNWIIKSTLGVVCIAFYLYAEFYLRDVKPIFSLLPSVVNFFSLSNAVLCFFLAALWGIVLAISYNRTVAALIKKEQELFAVEKAAEQAEILNQLEKKERDNEIFQLRNVELKNRNDEILVQKQTIEKLVSEQEVIIQLRTKELAETNIKLKKTNTKLVELIQYNAHNLREPLTRIMGAMLIVDCMSQEEFYEEIWPQMSKAAQDLDRNLREVITFANDTIREQEDE